MPNSENENRTASHGYQELSHLVAQVTSDATTLDELFESLAQTAQTLIGARHATCTIIHGDGIDGWARAQNRPISAETPVRGRLAVPLTAPDGTTLGLLQLWDRHEGDFTEHDQRLAELLAVIGSTALEHRRLVETAGADRRRLQAVNDALPGGILVRDTDGRVTYSNT